MTKKRMVTIFNRVSRAPGPDGLSTEIVGGPGGFVVRGGDGSNLTGPGKFIVFSSSLASVTGVGRG